MKTTLITLFTLFISLNSSAGFNNAVCINTDQSMRIQEFLPSATQGVVIKDVNNQKDFLSFEEVKISYEDEKIIDEETGLSFCDFDQNSTPALLVGAKSIKRTSLSKVTIKLKDGSSFPADTKNLQTDGSVSSYMICERSFTTRVVCP